MGDPALGNLVDVPGEADGVVAGGARSVGRGRSIIHVIHNREKCISG